MIEKFPIANPLFKALKLRCIHFCVNDPSAGSPTETLLRLLLPLSDKVYLTSRVIANPVQKVHRTTRNR